MTLKGDKDIFEKTGKEFIDFLDKGNSASHTDIDIGWEEVRRTTTRLKRKRNLYRITYSAAAMVCLILVSTFIFFLHTLTGRF